MTIYSFYQVTNFLLNGEHILSLANGLATLRIQYSPYYIYTAPFILIYLLNMNGYISNNEINEKTRMNQSFIKKMFLIFFFSFALIVPSASKGLLLVYLLIVVLFLITCLIESNPKKIILFIITMTVLVLIFVKFSNVLEYSYSNSDESNSIRSEQAEFLLNEITFTGSGLGSTLVSGYARDDTGFGFELSYINLIQKIGVLSMPVLLLYILTLYHGVKMFISKKNRIDGAFTIGIMGYLIPSIGNPTLFAPSLVLLHCILLVFLLRKITD
jgi:hypothetical protein